MLHKCLKSQIVGVAIRESIVPQKFLRGHPRLWGEYWTGNYFRMVLTTFYFTIPLNLCAPIILFCKVLLFVESVSNYENCFKNVFFYKVCIPLLELHSLAHVYFCFAKFCGISTLRMLMKDLSQKSSLIEASL